MEHMSLRGTKRTVELNCEKQSILMSISKSVVTNMEVCFLFGTKHCWKKLWKLWVPDS